MRRKKTIIIGVMCVAILFMSIGYALLSSRLNISGSTAVTSTWRVEFSSIRTLSQKGGATNKIVPEASATTATFEVDLVQPGDEIVYEIGITNFGDIDAEVKGASYTVTGSEAIYMTIDGVRKGTLIGSCEDLAVCPTVYLTLKVGYDPEVTKDPTEKTKDIIVTLDIGQYVDTNPTPDGELIPELQDAPTIVQQILSDNRVQSDVSLSFTPKYSSVRSDIKTMTVPSTTNYYYFGNSYTFNSTTGKYSINATYAYDTWSSLAATALIPTTPYTCFATSSTATCDKLYQIATSTSGSSSYTGYVYEAVQDPVGDGVYFTTKNTEGNLPTYYFRGEVDNNFIDIGMTKDEGSCTYNGNAVQVYDSSLSTSVAVTDEATCKSTKVCADPFGVYMLNVDQEACEFNFNGTMLDDYATWTPSLVPDLWRIVRINEDGSVRLMYNDSIGKHNFNTTAATSTTPYIANDNAHVGYMYGTTGSTTYAATHANINDSTVKTVLDDWYEINLKTDYADYLVDAGFCNDRSKAPKPNLWRYNQYFQDSALGYGQNMTIYGAYNRLSNNKAPQFACPQTNDLFTTNTSSKGNKALDYPIGLITADEVMYAGKNNNYMCNGSSFLTMSPSEYYLNFSQYYMGCNLSDFITSYDSTGLFDVRPVVNIKGNIAVLSGDGTKDNPYVLNLE